jgi:dihydroorotase
MADGFDLVVRGGTIVTPNGVERADIGISDGRFAGFGDLSRAPAAATLDAAGLTVLPGVIDTQVHFREPGATHKEDIAHGTRAAVLGGVTAVFEMPNTTPLTLTPADIADKIERGRNGGWCDFAYYVGGSAENAERLADLERLPGVPGVKVFMGSSTGSLLAEDDATLARILANGRRRVAVHAEDEPRLKQRRKLAEEAGSATAHHIWRDVETALRATTRLLDLARYAGRRVHVLHVTTAEEMDLLGQNRDLASVEVTPNHLTMAAPECYERLGSLAQMNPPVREQRHQDALWQAIRDGVVDMIGSDHAPHTLEEKAKPYPQSPSGMPGVQTLVPVMLDHVNAGRLSLARFVDLVCGGPQRVFGIAGKGRIALGYDADLTLVDLKARRTITNDWIASKCGWTPMDGKTVTGWPMATVIRGRTVMRDGEVLGEPGGEPLRFMETL